MIIFMSKADNKSDFEMDSFDFVKVNLSNNKSKNVPHCTLRYKGISFCLTEDNIELILKFIQRLNHAGSF